MSIEDSDAALTIVEAGRQRVRARLQAAFDRQVEAHPELGAVDAAELVRLVDDSVERAGASLWRIGLAEGAAESFGLTVSAALSHPAVASAEELVNPPDEPRLRPTGTAAQAGPEPVTAPAVAPIGAAPDLAPGATVANDGATGAGADATGGAGGADAPEAGVAAEETAPQALRIPAVHVSGIETLKAGEKDIELRLSDAGLDVLRRSSGVAIGRLEWGEITTVEVEAARKGLRGRRRNQSLQVRTARGHAQFDLPGLSEQETAEHLEPLLERLRAAGELASGNQ